MATVMGTILHEYEQREMQEHQRAHERAQMEVREYERLQNSPMYSYTTQPFPPEQLETQWYLPQEANIGTVEVTVGDSTGPAQLTPEAVREAQDSLFTTDYTHQTYATGINISMAGSGGGLDVAIEEPKPIPATDFGEWLSRKYNTHV